MSNRVDFDKFTDNYNQLLNDKTRFFSADDEYFARYKVDIIRLLVKPPVRRVLEYGCGIGRNIPFLLEAFAGAFVVGSDISHASLEIARRDNAGVEFIEEDGSVELSGRFDVIFVAGVFHHVPVDKRVDVARSLSARLAPGGVIFVFEHNPFNPLTRRIVGNCPYDEDAVLLRPSELRRVLCMAGLRVERKSYCLFVPPRLSMLKWLEKWLGWLPLGGQYWVEARG
jgi:SAM-dependent methyltransferase